MYSRNIRNRDDRPLRIPENYGGSFLMKQREDPPRSDEYRADACKASRESKRFAGERRDLREKMHENPYEETHCDLPRNDIQENEADDVEDRHECDSREENDCRPSMPSVFSKSLLPINLASHFPFGHGLGFEELFLLGLILVLFNNQADDQIIVLLIVLLFCG